MFIWTLKPNYKSTKVQSYKCLHQQIPIQILLLKEILFFSDTDTNTSITYQYHKLDLINTNTNTSKGVWDSSIPILVSKFEIYQYLYWYLVSKVKVSINDSDTDTDTSKVIWTFEIPIIVSITKLQWYRHQYLYYYPDLIDTDTWYQRIKT